LILFDVFLLLSLNPLTRGLHFRCSSYVIIVIINIIIIITIANIIKVNIQQQKNCSETAPENFV